MLFQNIIEFFKKLFGVKPRTTDAEQAVNASYDAKYRDITDINLTALISQKIANMVVSDSEIAVTGDNPRAEFLGECLSSFTPKMKNATARALGVGGVVVKPYAYGGKLYADILPQRRFINVEQYGDVITASGFDAEIFVRDNKTYTRVEYHKLDGGRYTIEQKALIDGKEVPLTSVPEWSNMKPSVTIQGVDKMLFGLITCPVDNREQFTDVYGKPITYGQDKLVGEIVALMNEFQKELLRKGVFIGVSSLIFGKNNKVPDNGLYMTFDTDTKLGTGQSPMFETFSPDIRDQSYINTINFKMGLLEKAIGVNQGVLTDLDTADATATAIRRSTFDTWALVDDIRTNIQAGIDAFVYACDIYANAGNLAPRGEYAIDYDWDYSLLEDTTETWTQLAELETRGGVTLERLNQFVTGQDEEAAAEEVAKAKAAKPAAAGFDIDSLLSAPTGGDILAS